MPRRNDWVRFEGYWLTKRSVAMLTEARRLFVDATGHQPPRIVQGGLNGTKVKASGGTHGREAIDFDTAGWNSKLQRAWELACRKVGFAAWWRHRIPGVWNEHCHVIPKGGDLSQEAGWQEQNFKDGETGLTGHAKDPSIPKSLRYMTWESYLKNHPPEKGGHIMAAAKDVHFNFKGQKVAAKVETELELNADGDLSVIIGESAGVDLLASLAIEGLPPEGSVKAWFRIVDYAKDEKPQKVADNRVGQTVHGATDSGRVDVQCTFKGNMKKPSAAGRSYRLRLILAATHPVTVRELEINGWEL